MAGECFGAADFGTLVVGEDSFEGVEFGEVAGVGRGGVGVEVIDGAGIEIRVLKGVRHRTGKAVAAGIRGDDVVTVGGLAPTFDFGVNGRTTGGGVFGVFKDERGSTAGDDEAVAIHIKGSWS